MTPRPGARRDHAAAALALVVAACSSNVLTSRTLPSPSPAGAPTLAPDRPARLSKGPRLVMVDTVVSDSGSVSVGIIAGRTIVTLRSPLGTFGVGGDSARIAAWSDSASEAVGARLLAALQARHDETHSVGDRPFDASYEFEVERPVQAARGNPAPTFPAELRNAHVPGEVLLQFVVDTTGRPDLSTVRALAYTRPEFARATRAVLPLYRFIPARAGGRLVRQIVQLPFQFSFDY